MSDASSGIATPGVADRDAPAPAIRLRGVTKRFGATVAVDAIDLAVPAGSVFGLVGPNGAGKTTTLSLVCGFLRADAGAVEVLGGPPDAMRTKGRLSALPQDAQLGRETSVRTHLIHFGRLQGLPRERAEAEAARVLALVGMADAAPRRAKALSHGMLKAVGVAQAFVGDPELALLDEPTAGLDPRRAFELRETIARARGARTVVISSHNLHELEQLCDHAAIVDRGRVVAGGSMAALTRRDAEVQILLAGPPASAALIDALRARLDGVDVRWIEETRRLHFVFAPAPGREAEDVIGAALRVLLDEGARIAGVSKGETLERRYLEMT